jgi:hypothetical protein
MDLTYALATILAAVCPSGIVKQPPGLEPLVHLHFFDSELISKT